MKVSILCEQGYAPAMLGLSLNKRKDPANMPAVAKRLSGKDQGHDKFLRLIVIWLDVTAPRYWWHEMDQYKIGRVDLAGDEGDIQTESSSTMNNLRDRELTQDDFEYALHPAVLENANNLLFAAKAGLMKLEKLKNVLPEGYLQRRVLMINYKVAYDIIATRSTHRLPQWQIFCNTLRGLEHAELLP